MTPITPTTTNIQHMQYRFRMVISSIFSVRCHSAMGIFPAGGSAAGGVVAGGVGDLPGALTPEPGDVVGLVGGVGVVGVVAPVPVPVPVAGTAPERLAFHSRTS